MPATGRLAPPPDPYVTVIVAPAASVRPVTWICWPETPSVPAETAVKPAPAVVRGADQPEGTVIPSEPPLIPPAPAVNVHVIADPIATPRATLVGPAVWEIEPAAFAS